MDSLSLDPRAYQLALLTRLAMPVLDAGRSGRLRRDMPVETVGERDRSKCSHLEAAGRLLCGMAPWLELQSKTEDAHDLLATSQAMLASLCDPASDDYLDFAQEKQSLVDAAFLAQAMLRAPRALWADLPGAAQRNLVVALLRTRTIKPYVNNWLLFSAMIEAALDLAGETWDAMRVDYALRQFEQWYLGDGVYGDGPQFRCDYYNSFVIHPMLVEITRQFQGKDKGWNGMQKTILIRARRYAAIQERMIAPDGSFPVVGRSLAYRCGAFHALAAAALGGYLPDGLSLGQVRQALTAVIHRTLDNSDTFDAAGWLRIGLNGAQPGLGESYISTGSLYLCSTAFLPLGLSEDDPFWSSPSQPWTQKAVWSLGHDWPADTAL